MQTRESVVTMDYISDNDNAMARKRTNKTRGKQVPLAPVEPDEEITDEMMVSPAILPDPHGIRGSSMPFQPTPINRVALPSSQWEYTSQVESQTLMMNEYLECKPETKVIVQTACLDDYIPDHVRYRHIGPMQSPEALVEVTNGTSYLQWVGIARCQKHPTRPQALHLARILNPLTTALRFRAIMNQEIQMFQYLCLRTSTWVRASVLDNFMMALNTANQVSELSHVLAWPSEYTNDAIMRYDSLTTTSVFNTFRFTQNQVHHTMGTICESYDLHCFPICDYTHWILCVYEVKTKTLFRLDSMKPVPTRGDSACPMTLKLKTKLELVLGYTLKIRECYSPEQTDNNMCGICVCRAVDAIMAKVNMEDEDSNSESYLDQKPKAKNSPKKRKKVKERPSNAVSPEEEDSDEDSTGSYSKFLEFDVNYEVTEEADNYCRLEILYWIMTAAMQWSPVVTSRDDGETAQPAMSTAAITLGTLMVSGAKKNRMRLRQDGPPGAVVDLDKTKKYARQELQSLKRAATLFSEYESMYNEKGAATKLLSHMESADLTPKKLLSQPDEEGAMSTPYRTPQKTHPSTPTPHPSILAKEAELVRNRVRCPVCNQWVECNDSTNITFEAEFSAVGDAKLPRNVNIVNLRRDFQNHSDHYHSLEPVWNTIPRQDLASSDDGTLAPVTSGRVKSKIATVAGLVNYGLSYSNRHMPALPIDLGEDWSVMRYVMFLKLGNATAVVKDGSVYLRGRTAVLNAPLDPSWSESKKNTKQRNWLKQEALRYITQLCMALAFASPSNEWMRSTRERRRNSHHIFFAHRDNHRTCPALLVYRPNDLPPYYIGCSDM
jgi:hypothetical protein